MAQWLRLGTIIPQEYTYLEAVALGITDPVNVQDSGLPLCPFDPMWPGFASSAEADAVIRESDDAPLCLADPVHTVISVGRPVPHPSYHWAGAQTVGKFQSGRITVEVGDPSVHHTDPQEFVVSRVLAKTDFGHWLEAGWGEASWRTETRFVYTYQTENNQWNYHTAYPLITGNYYSFRVRDCSPFPWQPKACADIFWNGNWIQLRTNGMMRCLNADGSNNCGIEEFLEIYSEQSGSPHPLSNAPADGPGVNFRASALRTAPDVWPLWTHSSYPGGTAPYSPVCWTWLYYEFRAGKNLTCSLDETPAPVGGLPDPNDTEAEG